MTKDALHFLYLFYRKSKTVIPEPEPEPIPVKVKLVLKGPHCWVDDATVSSDQSDHEDLQIPEEPPAPVEEPPPPPPEPVPEKVETKNKKGKKGKGKSVLKNSKDKSKKEQSRENAKSEASNEVSKQPIEKVIEIAKTETVSQDKTVNNIAEPEVKPISDVNGNEFKEEVIEEEKEVEIKLPSFICPSSERKSREAALKNWLATTCFSSGHREIPIL